MQMMREIEGVRNLASNVARLMEAGSDPALKKTKGVKVAFQNDYTKKKKTLRSTFIVFFSFFSFFSLSFDFLYDQFSSMRTNRYLPNSISPYSLAFDFIPLAAFDRHCSIFIFPRTVNLLNRPSCIFIGREIARNRFVPSLFFPSLPPLPLSLFPTSFSSSSPFACPKILFLFSPCIELSGFVRSLIARG